MQVSRVSRNPRHPRHGMLKASNMPCLSATTAGGQTPLTRNARCGILTTQRRGSTTSSSSEIDSKLAFVQEFQFNLLRKDAAISHAHNALPGSESPCIAHKSRLWLKMAPNLRSPSLVTDSIWNNLNPNDHSSLFGIG